MTNDIDSHKFACVIARTLDDKLGKDIAESIPYDDYLYKKTSAKKFNALAQSYNDASKKSGLFAGLGIGVVDIYTSGNVDNEFVITRITPIIYNLNGGYQKFFNHYMGVRLYGGISTSLFSDVQRYNINNGEYQMVPNPYNAGGNIQSFYALGTISADFLFEFPLTNTFRHYIGGFAGINIGFMYYRPYATHPQKGSYYPASYIWNYKPHVLDKTKHFRWIQVVRLSRSCYSPEALAKMEYHFLCSEINFPNRYSLFMQYKSAFLH